MKREEFFRLNITFSLTCPKNEIGKKLGVRKYTVENTDFEGTEEETHSGSFTKNLKVTSDTDLMRVVNDYIRKNDLVGECFSVQTMNRITLFTEVEFSQIKFY